MQNIVGGIREFQSNVFPGYERRFQELASSPAPEAQFITCADSRVVPELFTQCASRVTPKPVRGSCLSVAMECARRIVCENHGDLAEHQQLSQLIQENVIAQSENVRTHPCVACAMGAW